MGDLFAFQVTISTYKQTYGWICNTAITDVHPFVYLNFVNRFVIVEKRQDYENPLQRIYFFQIFINDIQTFSLAEPSIFVKLENIFDNQPSLTYAPSPCKVEVMKCQKEKCS